MQKGLLQDKEWQYMCAKFCLRENILSGAKTIPHPGSKAFPTSCVS